MFIPVCVSLSARVSGSLAAKPYTSHRSHVTFIILKLTQCLSLDCATRCTSLHVPICTTRSRSLKTFQPLAVAHTIHASFRCSTMGYRRQCPKPLGLSACARERG